ncbi:MAG: hypothetical protein IJH43_02425 [Mogibacterium sp.]|nr:hypothetical protein [Mogibacterium sp.]
MYEFKPGYVRVGFNKSSSAYEFRNYLTGMEGTMTPACAYFLSQLDGTRNPLEIGEELGWSDRKTAEVLVDMLSDGIVRDSRVLKVGGDGSSNLFMFTLWTPKWMKPPKALRYFSMTVLSMIFILFIPAIIAGTVLCIMDPVTSEDFHFSLMILTSILSIFLHEMGHLMAGVTFGANIYEAGLFPGGAYVMIDDQRLPGKLQRAEISAAGIEVNLLIAGICMIIASTMNNRDAWIMAIANLCLAITNFAPISGADGNELLGALMGFDPAEAANKVCRNQNVKEKLYTEEYGLRVVASCYLIRVSQVLLFAGGAAIWLIAWL